MKNRWTVLFVIGCAAACGCGCDAEKREAKGFRLPDGDIEKGKEAFVALNCQTCHTVSGVKLPPASSPGQHNVILGGVVVKVKSYGELVTAVIHPAHDIAKTFDATKMEGELSPMPQYNQVLTVEQMVDIVSFLHSRYKQRPVQIDYYFGPW